MDSSSLLHHLDPRWTPKTGQAWTRGPAPARPPPFRGLLEVLPDLGARVLPQVGGLDSLLEPTGNIKVAQDKATRALGGDRSFFVTNDTLTSNKIRAQFNRPLERLMLEEDPVERGFGILVVPGDATGRQRPTVGFILPVVPSVGALRWAGRRGMGDSGQHERADAATSTRPSPAA